MNNLLYSVQLSPDAILLWKFAEMTDQNPAQIEYFGVGGSSLDCESAIVRLVQTDAVPKSARILTFDGEHGIFLTTDIGDQIAVKAGFASGYGGTGPNSLSLVLQMLKTHGCEIDECKVTGELLERLNLSALTESDVDTIVSAKPVRPSKWPEYILDRHDKGYRDGSFWREVRPVLPYAMIDERIFDLALQFNDDPNNSILIGYRRLEDILRLRTKTTEHGHKLMVKAFVGEKSALYWSLSDQGEHNGRAGLFTSAFLAHRNPRAHREVEATRQQQIEEFIVLNMLFGLEKSAADREVVSEENSQSPSV